MKVHNLTAALFLVLAITAQAQQTFVINKSGSNFTVAEGEIIIGTNTDISFLLNLISDRAQGQSTIQFGNGTDTLGTYDPLFMIHFPSFPRSTVTLTGKLKAGSIWLGSGVSLESRADVIGSFVNEGGALTIAGGTISASSDIENRTGTLNISGGTISLNTNYMIKNVSGTLNISGGTISSIGDCTWFSGKCTRIYNESGTVNISGGTILASTGHAVRDSMGKVTVSGNAKITSSADEAIYIGNGGSQTTERIEITGGTVENTGDGTAVYIFNGIAKISGGTVSATTGTAVRNHSQGTAIISGGTVSATEGRAVYHSNSGTTNISGGTILATIGNAIYSGYYTGKITVSDSAKVTSANPDLSKGTIYFEYNGPSSTLQLDISNGRIENTANGNAIYNNTAVINISGGTVSATIGSAVYNYSTGKINVMGNANVTSANPSTNQGTIYLANNGSETATRITITDSATVENTATNGYAVYNASTGGLLVAGAGKVLAKNGYAIYKSNTGATTVLSGGFAFAYGTAISNVIYGTYNATTDGNAVIAGWNKAATTEYTAKTDTDIEKYPSTALVTWDGRGGIAYANDDNIGFIPLDVTVGKVQPVAVFPTTDSITYSPTQTLSQIPFIDGTGDGTFAWENPNTVPTAGNNSYSVVFTPSDINNYATSKDMVALTVTKADGATAAAPTLAAKNLSSITINAVAASTGQEVEYSISKNNIAPADATSWQKIILPATTLTFAPLESYIDYYIFARAIENTNYKQGVASEALPVNTNSVIAPSSSSGGSSSSSDNTPIRLLPQIAKANYAMQTKNGISLAATKGAVVEIYALSGNLIKRQNYAAGIYAVSFGHLPKGMYMVRVSFGNETKLLRVPIM